MPNANHYAVKFGKMSFCVLLLPGTECERQVKFIATIYVIDRVDDDIDTAVSVLCQSHN
jgi:hypothetical protein